MNFLFLTKKLSGEATFPLACRAESHSSAGCLQFVMREPKDFLILSNQQCTWHLLVRPDKVNCELSQVKGICEVTTEESDASLQSL